MILGSRLLVFSVFCTPVHRLRLQLNNAKDLLKRSIFSLGITKCVREREQRPLFVRSPVNRGLSDGTPACLPAAIKHVLNTSDKVRFSGVIRWREGDTFYEGDSDTDG